MTNERKVSDLDNAPGPSEGSSDHARPQDDADDFFKNLNSFFFRPEVEECVGGGVSLYQQPSEVCHGGG